jgi:glycerol kinase
VTTVLTIDQGTSGTKAAVVTGDAVGAVVEEAVSPVYLSGGGVEQDPEALWRSVTAAGRRAVGASSTTIDAVALANQGETVLAWDPRTGQPLSPAIVWQDRRASALCSGIAEHGDTVAERTGLVLDPYFSAPKMAWLRSQGFTDGVVTTIDTWLLHRLTGAFVTDVSTASRSLIFDLDRRRWDDELLDLFGLGAERLPAIVDCDTVVGETTVFGGRAAVTGLIVDQQSALFAERCFDAGSAKCTYGTGAFLLANTGDQATRSKAGLSSSVAWRARGDTRYCLDGQIYTAASAVRWLQQLGFLRNAADLDTVTLDAGREDSKSAVLCVPALAGLAAPWWRADATATFTGMTLSTQPSHLVFAVLQGIAAQVAELLTLVESGLGAGLEALRADGGLTRSTTLMQAQADLAQLPVEIYPAAHATLLGAAALAKLALDPTLLFDDAIGSWTPARTYEPHWSADRAKEFRHRWRAIADIS